MQIWFRVSGAQAKLESEVDGYETYQQAAAHETTVAQKEIEKDLKRTFPGHRDIDTEEGLLKLRRVLTAYAARNPKVRPCCPASSTKLWQCPHGNRRVPQPP